MDLYFSRCDLLTLLMLVALFVSICPLTLSWLIPYGTRQQTMLKSSC
jgi:hypothetical protein